jgi:hypothetical protein
MSDKLNELLEKAKNVKLSPEQKGTAPRFRLRQHEHRKPAHHPRNRRSGSGRAKEGPLATNMSDEERHSKALEIELICDPEQKARQEAENGLRQYDEVIERINYSLQPERPFKLRPSAILSLHRRALEGISSFAGVFRPGGIEIKGCKHAPPGAHLVPELLEQMRDYISENWTKASPLGPAPEEI